MHCEICGLQLDDAAGACARGHQRGASGGLARNAYGDLARDLAQDLARSMTDSLLASSQQLADLTRYPEATGPLTMAELRGTANRLVGATSDASLEQLLSPDVARLNIDGLRISDLIDRKGNDIDVVKKGLLFLKHSRFREAMQWWALHREGLSGDRPKLELLLIMMQAFTCSLAGDREALARARKELAAHPAANQLRRC
jgi:hypothetical protein